MFIHTITGHLSPEKNLALFLWYVGHQTASYCDVAHQFNVAYSTMFDILNRVANFICDLSPGIINWPNKNEQTDIAKHFEKLSFPNVVGCIDGTHIKIDKPNVTQFESYVNRKGFYSVQLQIVCDNKKKIRDIFLGYPGSVHDARVFMESDTLNKCYELVENGKYIIGDSAYPLVDFLLVPYKDNGFLTQNQKNFNKKLSSSRVYIEHTIGLLKQRFRILYHIKLRKIPLIYKIIKSCCVLHNLCPEDFPFIPEDHEDDDCGYLEEDNVSSISEENKTRGKILRDLICDSLSK